MAKLLMYPTYRSSRVFIATIFHRGAHARSSPGGHHLATDDAVRTSACETRPLNAQTGLIDEERMDEQ